MPAGGVRSLLARTLQAFGLAVTLAGLVAGIGMRSMSMELGLVGVGCASFLAGRGLAGGRG